MNDGICWRMRQDRRGVASRNPEKVRGACGQSRLGSRLCSTLLGLCRGAHLERQRRRRPLMIRIRATRRGRLAWLPAAMLAFTSAAFAQTNWSIEGSVPTYGEFNAPACPTIPFPPYAVFGPPIPLPGCPTLMPFPPLTCRGGGTGVDNNGNFLSGGPAFPVIVNTDGFTITMSTP